MTRYAIIVAGGIGRRAGSELPKQFVRLLGIPMLWWSVRAFLAFDPGTKIILVLHPSYIQDFSDLVLKHLPEDERHFPIELVAGGKDRLESVSNGLDLIAKQMINAKEEGNCLVAVHDAARPLLTADLLGRVWEEASLSGACVPVIPVTDSLRKIEGEMSACVDRADYRIVQTPQAFRFRELQSAYARIGADRLCLTDDASVIEAAGHRVNLVEGSPANIKVTNPSDFKIASLLLENEAPTSVNS